MTDDGSTNRRMLLLVEGGPIYRIEKRIGLIREESPCIVRRAFLSILVTWVPLLLLSSLQGNAVGGHVVVPFLRDFAVHARFLLALPLFIFAEVILGPSLAEASIHFIQSGVILEEDHERFENIVERGLRWRDSPFPELVIILLSYVSATISLRTMAVHVSTWYEIPMDSKGSLTWAGWWLTLFCVPLFQFLALRWLWRLFLWEQFLWRIRKFHLQLIPTHPDEAGGLAFVGEAHRFFSIILFSASIAVSGVLANNIVYDRIPLSQFASTIAVYVLVAVVIALSPLFVFSSILVKTKRIGLLKYGALATEYTSSFQKKWIGTRSLRSGELLGTGDIQSLADLGNSYSYIVKMGILPTGIRTVLAFALACLIPMVPLLLTMMPLKQIVMVVFRVFL